MKRSGTAGSQASASLDVAAAAGQADARLAGPLGKRLIDFPLAAAGLAVFAPVGLVIAVFVKLTSPGPVLYRASRVGQFGRPFTMLKFRTMVADADRRGGWATQPDDPRVTRFGRWLRRTSLDEVPQLWNVLRGEMSLVGPRPATPAQLQGYEPRIRQARATALPGLTGLTQIRGRSTLSARRGALYDAWYASHQTLRLDLYIMAKTVTVLLSQRGTN